MYPKQRMLIPIQIKLPFGVEKLPFGVKKEALRPKAREENPINVKSTQINLFNFAKNLISHHH